jgi:hypothetical protein
MAALSGPVPANCGSSAGLEVGTAGPVNPPSKQLLGDGQEARHSSQASRIRCVWPGVNSV